MICLEVKGGTLAYDGTEDCWYQNGKPMARSPERQASAATHALIAHLKPKIQSVAVDWGLCFPQCCIQPGETATGLPAENIIDERKLGNIEQAVRVLEERIKKKFPRSGASPREAQALIATLTRNIGFVQKLGVRIAREREQLIQITQEQLDVLNDLEVNRRVVVQGSAGTGKTIIAQEFAKRLLEDGKSVLLVFYKFHDGLGRAATSARQIISPRVKQTSSFRGRNMYFALGKFFP
jgi:hypothetical protein